MPQSAGDCTPAGGGRCLPRVLNIWPMNPAGVQLASPMRPPGRHTRASSAAACAWSGANMTPKVDSTTSNACRVEGQRLGVGALEVHLQALGARALGAALQQGAAT